MKIKNLLQILLYCFILCFSTINVFAFDFHITAPASSYPRLSIALGDNSCWPIPVILSANQTYMNVTFDVTGANSTDCYNYIINVIQFNNTNTLATGTNCDTRTINEQVNLSSFCFNTEAEIRIIVTYNNNQYIKSRFVRLYSEQSSLGCPLGQGKHAAVWSRTTQNLGNINFQVSHDNPCGMSTTSGSATKYKVTFTVNGNFQNKGVVVDNNLSYGFNGANPNSQYRWGWANNPSNNQAVFYTFVYWFTIPAYGTYWWPCSPDDAAIVYDIYDNPPPVLVNTVQSPGIIYRGETGHLQAIFSQGECCGQWCNWIPHNQPAGLTDNRNQYPTTLTITNNSTGLDGEGDTPTYTYDVQAGNSWGYSNWLTSQPVSGLGWSNQYRGGGCPYVFVQDINGQFKSDNNILHRSEFQENSGIDITDMYKLTSSPGIIDNTINIKVIETTHDYNYLDKLTLYAVDHPRGTEVGVTESNQIVVYDTNKVSNPGNAYWNSIENETRYINYNYQGDTVVTGGTGDNVSTGDMINPINSTGDSLALIIGVGKNRDIIGNPIVNKDFAGDINIYANSSPVAISKRFARRENVSEVVVPYAPASSTVDSARIVWNRNFELDWLGSVKVSYSGYTMTEIPLIAAFHPNYDDALPYLISKDNVYLELDSSYQLSLTFSNIGGPQNGYVRDYVFETDGRYTTSGGMNRPLGNINNQQNSVPYQNKLYTNYPNPFNPATKINYEISKSSFVKLIIYNVLGQEVKKLINEYKSAGSYSIDFDGSNLPSGLYIYKFETPYFSDSKKMVLIK